MRSFTEVWRDRKWRKELKHILRRNKSPMSEETIRTVFRISKDKAEHGVDRNGNEYHLLFYDTPGERRALEIFHGFRGGEFIKLHDGREALKFGTVNITTYGAAHHYLSENVLPVVDGERRARVQEVIRELSFRDPDAPFDDLELMEEASDLGGGKMGVPVTLEIGGRQITSHGELRAFLMDKLDDAQCVGDVRTGIEQVIRECERHTPDAPFIVPEEMLEDVEGGE